MTDPTRVTEITTEFRKKLAFVEGSYRATVRAVGSDLDFNRSLASLKRSLARKRPAKHRGERAHPEIEITILQHAMEHAQKRTGSPEAELCQEDANYGARKAAELLRPYRRPTNRILRHYVVGLMALVQQLTGRPVLLAHAKNNLYDPQAVNFGGRILLMLAQQLDPAASTSTIASIVKKARHQYAGKPMRFADFFPTYGHEVVSPKPSDMVGANHQVTTVLPFCPIYFP